MCYLTSSFTSIRPIMAWSTPVTVYAIVLELFSELEETQIESGNMLE
jgi:hypothetical protein